MDLVTISIKVDSDLLAEAKKVFDKARAKSIEISISQTKSYATAVCVIK